MLYIYFFYVTAAQTFLGEHHSFCPAVLRFAQESQKYHGHMVKHG